MKKVILATVCLMISYAQAYELETSYEIVKKDEHRLIDTAGIVHTVACVGSMKTLLMLDQHGNYSEKHIFPSKADCLDFSRLMNQASADAPLELVFSGNVLKRVKRNHR